MVWDRGSKYRFNWAIIGPTVKRLRNGVSLAGRWWPNIECWLGSFVVFRGSGPVLQRNPIFCDFKGGPGPLPPPPPLWIREVKTTGWWLSTKSIVRLDTVFLRSAVIVVADIENNIELSILYNCLRNILE